MNLDKLGLELHDRHLKTAYNEILWAISPEEYLGLCRTFMAKLFAKIVSD